MSCVNICLCRSINTCEDPEKKYVQKFKKCNNERILNIIHSKYRFCMYIWYCFDNTGRDMSMGMVYWSYFVMFTFSLFIQ